MRAGVLPCTALIHECNAGNIISPEACLGAFITCNYAETVPYQLSGKHKKKEKKKEPKPSASTNQNSSRIPVPSTPLTKFLPEKLQKRYQIKCCLHRKFAREADGSRINQEFQS